MSENNNFNWLSLLKALFVLFAMLATLYGSLSFIDSRIDKRISTPEYINKLADQIRPSLIFDSRGVILYDMGALKYIEKVNVIPHTKLVTPAKVIIKPKQYMTQAPLLTPIDPVWSTIKPKRGTGIDWEYDFEGYSQTGPIEVVRYRLEILSK